MPGDELTSRNNTIYVNGKKLVENWQHEPNLGSDIGYVKVPKGQYFMMGDNRPSSCDSRMWGTLPESLIVGKVVLRIWPLSHFGHP
jgi:signal peptidase I